MDATYNLYSILLFVGIVQCGVAALLLGARSVRLSQASDGWLAWVLVAIALENVPYLIGFMGLYDRVGWLANLPLSSSFLLGGAIWFYVRSVAKRPIPTLWISVWGAALAFDVGLRLVFWIEATTSRVPYAQTLGPTASSVLSVLGLLTGAAFVAAAVRELVRYRRRHPGTARARWLGQFGIVVGVGLLVTVAFWAVFAWGAEFSYARQWWMHAAYAALGYYVAVAGYGFSRRMEAGPVEEVQPDAAPAVLTDDELARWKQRLEHAMRRDRAYLRSDLTLADLAADVDAAPSLVSHAVNAGFGCNFNEWVNGYRVAAVQARLTEGAGDRLTLLAVALECGFNSKATFNRAFRRATGTTPSAWWADQKARGGRTSSSEPPQVAM